MPTEAQMTRAREVAATAWCVPETGDKVMDPELAFAFADILVKEMYAPALGCATTGQILDELRARIEVDGKLDYKSIDSE